MSLFEAHKSTLSLKYGLPQELIQAWESQELLRSLLPGEVREYLGREDVDSTGLLFRYPGNGAANIRLDTPPVKNGKPQKYLRRAGEPNFLFNPGVDLAQAQEVWITEGEAKALCGFARGLPIVGLSGVYNWRTQGEEVELLAEGEKLKDDEALLPELAQVNWSGKKVSLLYDSDITPGHRAYPAYERLAEQLYRLGSEGVRILSLPSVDQGQKTGLDEFILAKGKEALPALQAMKDRKEPYLPRASGAIAYAERLIKSRSLEDQLNATVAYLGAKGKVFTLDWLKRQGFQGEMKNALLSDAKERLSQLQVKPRAASSQTELSQSLGPEYDVPKTLLKDHLNEYDIDNLGRLSKVDWMDITKDGKTEFIRILNSLCNFVAWPVREIFKDNGISKERFIELQGILQGGAILKPVKISGKDFQKMEWLIDAWGMGAAIKPYQDKDVKYALQLMAQGGLPETVVYTHLGWRKLGDIWVYLHAGGAVGSEGVEIELPERLVKYSLPQKTEDLKEAVKAALSILELGPKEITYPSLAMVFLAPLMEPLRLAHIEPGFILYIWGKTGSLKSTLIALLLCFFGSFDQKTLPASFKDTSYYIEKLAFLAKDILLAVDDLYPAKNPKERAQLEGVLEHLSRNQGDRQGRNRMKADTSLREGLPPRGLTICSGEVMPLKGSSLARGLILHIREGDINQEKLTLAQIQKDLFSHAMRGYLEWLAPQMDALPGHFSEDFDNARREARKASKVRTRHSRLNEIVAHLSIGFNLFLRFAVFVEAISQDEAAKMLQEAWKIFNQVVDVQAKIADAEEPTKHFFEAIMELQAQGKVYFATMEGALPEIAEQTPGAVKIGWGPDNTGVYYLLYGPALEAVTKSLRGQEETLPLSKNDLLDAIEQKGLLAKKQGNRRVINKTIAGNDIRVLPISEKAFKLEDGENETL